jgi:hypothetical protein
MPWANQPIGLEIGKADTSEARVRERMFGHARFPSNGGRYAKASMPSRILFDLPRHKRPRVHPRGFERTSRIALENAGRPFARQLKKRKGTGRPEGVRHGLRS